MPLYEYECDNCGHRFERIQKFSDDLVSACPLCDGKVRKLVSSPAIQFKGTGWYVTDYADKPRSGGDIESGRESSGDKDAEKQASKKEDAGTKKSATTNASDLKTKSTPEKKSGKSSSTASN